MNVRHCAIMRANAHISPPNGYVHACIHPFRLLRPRPESGRDSLFQEHHEQLTAVCLWDDKFAGDRGKQACELVVGAGSSPVGAAKGKDRSDRPGPGPSPGHGPPPGLGLGLGPCAALPPVATSTAAR